MRAPPGAGGERSPRLDFHRPLQSIEREEGNALKLDDTEMAFFRREGSSDRRFGGARIAGDTDDHLP
jgi:hypothetical protein